MRITPEQLKKMEHFQLEKEKFYVLSLIATGENPLIVSDLNNYVIARSEVGLPTWIWTRDDISEEKIKELEEQLEQYYEPGENKFTSKKEVYDFLKQKHDLYNELEMGFLSCKEAMKPERGKGIFVKPDYSDKVTLAEYWRENVQELYHNKITQWEALEVVENWMEGKKFYVLKDSTGEIVSMAGYGLLEDMAKITHVYTPKEERRKGLYA